MSTQNDCRSGARIDNFRPSRANFIASAYISASAVGHRPIANFGVVPLSIKQTWAVWRWKKAAE